MSSGQLWVEPASGPDDFAASGAAWGVRYTWNSLHDLLREDAPLKALLHRNARWAGNRAGPPPFFQALWTSLGRSVDSRRPTTAQAMQLIALSLDTLLGRRARRSFDGALSSPFSSAAAAPHRKAIESGWSLLVARVHAWNETPPVTPAAMGRAAGKVEKIEEQIADLRAVRAGERLAAPAFALAKDVDTQRLSFPPPPSFDPRSFQDK